MIKMYEPQEDSLMLSEALKEFLKNQKCKKCLDMGTGTGVQGLVMKDYCEEVVCADINPDAVAHVSSLKEPLFKVVETDLFNNVEGVFDLIAFNPPYLPREEDEEDDKDLTGGTTGLSVVSRFVKESKDYLSKGGKLFFVVSSLSDVASLNELLREEGFEFKVVKREKFFFEELMIYEAHLL